MQNHQLCGECFSELSSGHQPVHLEDDPEYSVLPLR
jgi:hypothetical protein